MPANSRWDLIQRLKGYTAYSEPIIQFKYINQLDATTSQVYYLTFMYSSTCFGRPHAYHQGTTTAVAASGFTAGAWW